MKEKKDTELSVDEKPKRRAYTAPDFVSTLVFERKSLSCEVAARNQNPLPPASCGLQS